VSEPLYCEGCSDEIGPDHRGECDFYDRLESGDRPAFRFCAICGVDDCVCEERGEVGEP
jgi:hypothetical protein